MVEISWTGLLLLAMFSALVGMAFGISAGIAIGRKESKTEQVGEEYDSRRPSGVKAGVYHADDETLTNYITKREENRQRYARRSPYQESEILNGKHE